MSIYTPDGARIAEFVPPWLGDIPAVARSVVTINVPNHDDVFDPAQSHFDVRQIHFEVGKYPNGRPRYRLLDERSLNVFTDQQARFSRWDYWHYVPARAPQ
jgi:hypothetical protein